MCDRTASQGTSEPSLLTIVTLAGDLQRKLLYEFVERWQGGEGLPYGLHCARFELLQQFLRSFVVLRPREKICPVASDSIDQHRIVAMGSDIA
jgi:hypothetical protein